MKIDASSLTLLITLMGYAQAALRREVRSLLQEAYKLEQLDPRDNTAGEKTTVSQISDQDKDNDNNNNTQSHYTNNPPHKYCLHRSAVVSNDDDINNTPSKAGPPRAGTTYGYILCSAIKKPNVSKCISTYLVQPKRDSSSELSIYTLNDGIVPNNEDTADNYSYSYHYNTTLPKTLKGNFTFYLVETYDVFEPKIQNLHLTQSFPIVIS